MPQQYIIFKKVFVFCALMLINIINANKAITYKLNTGRFGDNLKSCVCALWLSYKENIPFLFTPFTHSKQLQIHYTCEHYSETKAAEFERKTFFYHDDILSFDLDSCLYITTFYVNPSIDWSDATFLAHIRALIKPAETWHYRTLPDNTATIAIHFRRGGAYDKINIKKRRPLQFPSIAYYVDALKILLTRIEGPCYVYIFTDDNNPNQLAEALLKELTPSDIERLTIDWHRTDMIEEQNPVLQDFFDMTQFNFLIRPRSNFSKYIPYLGNNVMVITPHSGSLREGPWGHIHSATISTYDEKSNCFMNEVITL